LFVFQVKRVTGNAERVAEKDAVSTVLPQELFQRDTAELRSQGNLENLVRLRQEERSTNPFHPSRCQFLYANDEDFDILSTIASTGARIDTAPDFINVPKPGPTRALQERVPLTIKKHVLKLWKAGNVLVFPLADILPDKPHVSDLHLVFQDSKNKPDSRLLEDLTNKTNGNALNDKAAKCTIIERFGAFHLPSIETII
jgi:hypothetical protein